MVNTKVVSLLFALNAINEFSSALHPCCLRTNKYNSVYFNCLKSLSKIQTKCQNVTAVLIQQRKHYSCQMMNMQSLPLQFSEILTHLFTLLMQSDCGPLKGGFERRAALCGPSVTREEVINDYNTHPCQYRERGEAAPLPRATSS